MQSKHDNMLVKLHSSGNQFYYRIDTWTMIHIALSEFGLRLKGFLECRCNGKAHSQKQHTRVLFHPCWPRYTKIPLVDNHGKFENTCYVSRISQIWRCGTQIVLEVVFWPNSFNKWDILRSKNHERTKKDEFTHAQSTNLVVIIGMPH